MAKKVSVEETHQHETNEDIWIVVNGEVYDMTEFAPEHPGGEESMLDATTIDAMWDGQEKETRSNVATSGNTMSEPKSKPDLSPKVKAEMRGAQEGAGWSRSLVYAM
ncbi:CYB2-lactate dehydrogenase cytochrome b2 [Fusarium sp. NRRL 52700]|nr:CYB2-lactate dehydrogenase cytochrome b2 [Fusarium sp. NRRL 52700]